MAKPLVDRFSRHNGPNECQEATFTTSELVKLGIAAIRYGRDLQAIAKAYEACKSKGDTHGVRSAIIEAHLKTHQFAMPLVGPDVARPIFDVVDVLHYAGRGKRHPLTALEEDLDGSSLPRWPQAPERLLVQAAAAAILVHFRNQQSLVRVADSIAAAMKDGDVSVSQSTVRSWATVLLKPANHKGNPLLNPLAVGFFEKTLATLKLHHTTQAPDAHLAEALKGLREHCCSILNLPIVAPRHKR